LFLPFKLSDISTRKTSVQNRKNDVNQPARYVGDLDLLAIGYGLCHPPKSLGLTQSTDRLMLGYPK
jgi:hypothetical protein